MKYEPSDSDCECPQVKTKRDKIQKQLTNRDKNNFTF